MLKWHGRTRESVEAGRAVPAPTVQISDASEPIAWLSVPDHVEMRVIFRSRRAAAKAKRLLES